MHYVTVFDASNWSALLRNWPVLAFFAVFIVVGGPATYAQRATPGERSWVAFNRRGTKIVFPFAMLAMLGIASGMIGGPILSAKALLAGNCTVMEGRISHFQPLPFEKGQEQFDLNGRHFAYSPRQNWGFRQVEAQGGPLHEGAQVRLCDFDGAILKLEVAR